MIEFVFPDNEEVLATHIQLTEENLSVEFEALQEQTYEERILEIDDRWAVRTPDEYDVDRDWVLCFEVPPA